MEVNIYVILPPKCIEFPQHSMVKIFFGNNSNVITSLRSNRPERICSLLVPIKKLKMFGGYISIIGASMEAKIKVISTSTFFCKFILIKNGNSF